VQKLEIPLTGQIPNATLQKNRGKYDSNMLFFRILAGCDEITKEYHCYPFDWFAIQFEISWFTSESINTPIVVIRALDAWQIALRPTFPLFRKSGAI